MTFDFIISATMVFVFLIGAIAIYPILQRFLFPNDSRTASSPSRFHACGV